MGKTSKNDLHARASRNRVESSYQHAARQLVSGKWTSKLGPDEDIEHESPDSIAEWYGVAVILKRAT